MKLFQTAAVMALLLALLPVFDGPAQGGAAARELLRESIGGSISPDIRLFDETGKELSLGSLLGTPVVLSLVYHGCGSICPKLLGDIAAAASSMNMKPGEDYRLVTVSFDEGDSPSLAASRKRNFTAAAGTAFPEDAWMFLTGKRDSILKLTGEAGFSFRREGEGFVHPRTLIILSADGRIVRYLPAGLVRPADLRMAIQEASGGWLQAYCFRYDAAEGRYVYNTGRVLLTVMVVAAALAVAWIRYSGSRMEACHAA